MGFEANLVEQHRIFRALTQENGELRALLADYEELTEQVPLYGADTLPWVSRRIELKARYDALMKGGKP